MSRPRRPDVPRLARALIASALLLASHPALADAATRPAAAAAPGDVLNFSLLDYRGRCHELRRADGRFVVLFFTSAECPVGRQYAPRLQAIADEWSAKGVVVWMLNAMPQNDPDDRKLDAMFTLGRFAPKQMLGDRYSSQVMRELLPEPVLGDRETLRRETRDYVFGTPPMPPVLRDANQLVTRQFQVKRTGEAVLIDTEISTVLYRGAVDDQFAEGARKPKPTKPYLREALTETLAGKPVSVAHTAAHGCAVTYLPAAAPDEQITYTQHVAPILRDHCAACHRDGDVAPFAMSSYAKVRGWSAMIREVLLDRRMPPWHADPHYGTFANDRALSAADAQTLLRWIERDCPRGEGDDPLAAAAPQSAEWELGKPDFVIDAPQQQIPATGTVDYRYVDADFVMPHDAWLRAAVTRPGNRAVIHHVIVRVRYPAGYATPPSEAYLFTTWVPGLAATPLPADTGVFVPKGARFNFEIHYTTNGQPQTDQTSVGLYLAPSKPRMRFETRACETRDIDIPPNAADARHTASYAFKRETMLYGLSPHMHVRGSWFRFTLLLPDGTRETLLSVPNYDFNWQTSYWLAEPRRVPAGSWLLCEGGFDNSARNPNNPDPTKRVGWGPQSWNEMFMGFFDVAEPIDPAAK